MDKKLLISILLIAIFCLFVAFLMGKPSPHRNAKTLNKDVVKFPTEIKSLNSFNSNEEAPFSIDIPNGFSKYRIFINKDLENIEIKKHSAEFFKKHARKQLLSKSNLEDKVFEAKIKNVAVENSYFKISKNGSLYFKGQTSNKEILLSKFSPEYFNQPNLFRSFSSKAAAIATKSKDNKKLEIAPDISKSLYLPIDSIVVTFYNDKSNLYSKKADYSSTATEITFTNSHKISHRDNSPLLAVVEEYKATALTATKTSATTSTTRPNTGNSSSSSGECRCNMMLKLNEINYGEPLEREYTDADVDADRDNPTGRVIGRFHAEEGVETGYRLTFYDTNGCYDPKLLSVITGDEARNSPFKNHAFRTALKFGTQIHTGGKSATLTTREALWYGVRKNAEDEICEDMSTQSVYNITINATFDNPRCNTSKLDTFEVSVDAPNATNTSWYRMQKSPQFYKVLASPPQTSCVGYNLPFSTSPVNCTSIQKYASSLSAYKQFKQSVIEEEQRHGQQACNTAFPFGNGGTMGAGGPLSNASIQSILRGAYPQNFCVQYKSRWFSKEASQAKRAQATAMKRAANGLAKALNAMISKIGSEKYRLWKEWTVKRDISLTQFVRGGSHYECAYGRHFDFTVPPPRPNVQTDINEVINELRAQS